jgi:hypothetical protein
MVRGTGITTGILLITIGAILAFAVNVSTTGIDLNTIGAILIVVGLIGILFSFLALGEVDWFGPRRYHDDAYVRESHDDDVTPPHTHRRVDTHDVVYEDDREGPHTERIRRTR